MTIKDIAKKSGYAVSTVSRALNGHPDVSPEAKKHIMQIVEKYSFVPNSNARRLKSQSSRTILILIKGANNLFFAGVLEKLQADFSKVGFATQLHYLDEEADEIAEAIIHQRENKPLGILFLGADLKNKEEQLKRIKVPSVIATTIFDNTDFKNLCCVGVDDIQAGKMAADFLIDCGHKDIAVLGGNINTSPISYQRFIGFSERYEKRLNKAYPINLYEKCSFSMDSGYRAIMRTLKKQLDFTAVFCMSDVTAIGAIRALFDKGLSVPKDVSVLGFDGIDSGKYCVPRLTTIHQPQEDISHKCVKLLIDAIENEITSANVILPCELLHAESVISLLSNRNSGGYI